MDIYLESSQDFNMGDHLSIDGQLYRIVYRVGDGVVCQGIDWISGIEPVELNHGAVKRVMTSEDF